MTKLGNIEKFFKLHYFIVINFIQTFGQIIVGAEQPEAYLNFLKSKKVGLVVNQTSMVKNVHLVDFLISNQINVNFIFAPEHGFRGISDAGEKIDDYIDKKTGIPVLSLYGKNKKPPQNIVNQLDVIVFDLQDVGVRFYTYISTLHYILESCVEYDKELIILDRPNPNGIHVNGPVLDLKFKSFVGMHPIPILHGLTVGELASMILGEGWVKNQSYKKLKIVTVKNYTHQTQYDLPIKPSPNLPNKKAIEWYASLALFEATPISVGRGTDIPFQIIGYPNPIFGNFQFIPKPIQGMCKNPPHAGNICYGIDLRNETVENGFSLKYLIDFYNKYPDKVNFFQASFFDKLAGTDKLRKQIMEGKSESEIKQSWQEELEEYKKIRKKYLLYKE